MPTRISAGRSALALPLAVALGMTTACGSSDSTPSPVPTDTVPLTEPSLETSLESASPTTTGAPSQAVSSTSAPTTSTSTAPPTTVASTTTSTPPLTDPELLAGGRVLCAYVGQEVPGFVLDRLRQGLAAGVLLFGDNVEDQQATLAATAASQQAATASPAAAPALITIDQEGGNVARLPGPPSAGAAELGTSDAASIREEGLATGTNLRAWGINVDLAPVADVERPGGFIERQARSFGRDPTAVGASVAAFIEGLATAGVGSALKHFPGLGAATENTDEEVAVVDLPVDVLRSVDLPPFSAGIDAGADMVMMSSAIYPAVDDQPALFSSVWIEDVLRSELSFEGVVVSDALDTPALEPAGTIGERAVRAAAAGVDLLIGSAPDTCVDAQLALADAIASGDLPLEQAQLAHRRVDDLRSDLAS